MSRHSQFYIDGEWLAPVRETRLLPVINPATEQTIAQITLGSPDDADRAVAAARRAFADYARATREARLALLQSVIDVYTRRQEEIAQTIALEIGAPIELARQAHAPVGLGYLMRAKQVLADYRFDETVNDTVVTREPVGVCALITPWNWPMNQIACKVGPALAAGCTMVLKPSEIAPWSALLFAEILDEAGVPRGVSSTATVRALVRHWPCIRTWTWSRSRVRRVPAWPLPKQQPIRSSACTRSSAGSHRVSCSKMRISPRQ